MSRAHIGKKASLETRYKMAESRRGQKRSLTTRQLLSAQKLGNLNPMKNPETAHKVSNALIGRKQSFETNAKRAATMRLVWATRRAAHGLKGNSDMVSKIDFVKNLEIPRLSLEKKLDELVETLRICRPSLKARLKEKGINLPDDYNFPPFRDGE